MGEQGGNELLYPENAQRFIPAKRETPSKPCGLGWGIINTPEIIRNSSTGGNPVCSKSVDRTVAYHMGESEKIAVKFMVSEYTGHMIGPRNTVLTCVRR